MKKEKAIIIVFFFVVPLLLIVFSMRDKSPLHTGSTPDQVWSYVHTGGVLGVAAPNMLGFVKQGRWKADATNIECETQFRWQTSRTFAIQKIIYHFGTNGTLQYVESGWKLNWPFK